MIDLRKGLFAGLLALSLIGCGSPEPQEIDIDEVAAEAGLAKDDYTVHDNGAIEIKSKADDKVLWYQDDLSEPVENVGMLDADAILASAGLTPSEIIDSTDPEGEPKKIYLVDDKTSITAQFEHSSNYITLLWYMYSDEPQTLVNSQKSLKDAYKLARAMAGREGADAVMYLSNGGAYRSKPIGGYPATGQCNNGLCSFTIKLN